MSSVPPPVLPGGAYEASCCWVSPEGAQYACDWAGHVGLANRLCADLGWPCAGGAHDLFRGEHELERRGWAKVTGHPHYEDLWSVGMRDDPFRTVPRAQADALFAILEAFRVRRPGAVPSLQSDLRLYGVL